ncbi:dihydrofolate reductase family protein [Nonomuraea sp. NPDC004297]
MRKLVESTFVTLDGVIGDPHVWGSPYWDEEHRGYAAKLLFSADALLLGRETYEGFAETWSARSGDEYTDHINGLPTYVASTTLDKADAWNGRLIECNSSACCASGSRRSRRSS